MMFSRKRVNVNMIQEEIYQNRCIPHQKNDVSNMTTIAIMLTEPIWTLLALAEFLPGLDVVDEGAL